MSDIDLNIAKNLRATLVAATRDWFEKNGNDCKAVIGISGGKDSTVTAAICTEALGKDRVLGVLMPNGTQADIEDSKRVCDALGIRSICVNIEEAYNALLGYIESELKEINFCNELTKQTKINAAPRIRMTTLYAVAQTVGGRVINTSNASECFVGWGTRWGDTVGDFALLADLTTEEVVAVGLTYCDVIPVDLVLKAPGDGLTGKTDEDNLGVSYHDINLVINGHAEKVEPEIRKKIVERARYNKFKLMPIARPGEFSKVAKALEVNGI